MGEEGEGGWEVGEGGTTPLNILWMNHVSFSSVGRVRKEGGKGDEEKCLRGDSGPLFDLKKRGRNIRK